MRRTPALAVLVLAGASACAGGLPAPPTGPHRGDIPMTVPYPPPPAHVEIIPERPAKPEGTVWIDGEWLYQGHRWAWQPGRWQPPVPDAYYAPPTTVRLADGSLAWYPGTWHKRSP